MKHVEHYQCCEILFERSAIFCRTKDLLFAHLFFLGNIITLSAKNLLKIAFEVWGEQLGKRWSDPRVDNSIFTAHNNQDLTFGKCTQFVCLDRINDVGSCRFSDLFEQSTFPLAESYLASALVFHKGNLS